MSPQEAKESVKAFWEMPAAKWGTFVGGILVALFTGGWARGTVLSASGVAEIEGAVRQTAEQVKIHTEQIESLNGRMTRSETVDRYVACVLKYEAPAACESHLAPDVIESLRPR